MKTTAGSTSARPPANRYASGADAPKIIAASSCSRETPTKIAAVISTVVGRASAVWMSITAYVVSYRPASRKIRARGTDSTTIGSARTSSRNSWYVSLPRNAYRATAYPAGTPTTSASTTVPSPTVSELTKPPVTPVDRRNVDIVSVDGSVGSSGSGKRLSESRLDRAASV